VYLEVSAEVFGGKKGNNTDDVNCLAAFERMDDLVGKYFEQ